MGNNIEISQNFYGLQRELPTLPALPFQTLGNFVPIPESIIQLPQLIQETLIETAPVPVLPHYQKKTYSELTSALRSVLDRNDKSIVKEIEDIGRELLKTVASCDEVGPVTSQAPPSHEPFIKSWAKKIKSFFLGEEASVPPPDDKEDLKQFQILQSFIEREPIAISDRLLAHVLGDTFAKDSGLEGGNSANMIAYRLQSLQGLVQAIKSNSEDVIQDLKVFEKLIVQLEKAQDLSRALTTDIETFQSLFRKNIEDLQIGESFFFSGGWTKHAIVYEIYRIEDNSFTFKVHNTGDGINFHAQTFVDAKNIILPFTETTSVSREQLTDFIFLHELQNMAMDTDGVYKDKDLYLTLFRHLKTGFQISTYDEARSQAPQVSGTCSYMSLNAALSAQIDSPKAQYLQFLTEFKALVDYDRTQGSRYVISEESRRLTEKALAVFSEKIQHLHRERIVNDFALKYVVDKLHEIKERVASASKSYQKTIQRDAPIVKFKEDKESGIYKPVGPAIFSEIYQGSSENQVYDHQLLIIDWKPDKDTILADWKKIQEIFQTANAETKSVDCRLSIESFIRKLPSIDHPFWDTLNAKDIVEITSLLNHFSRKFLFSIIRSASLDSTRTNKLSSIEYLTQLKIFTLADKLTRQYKEELGFELPSLYQPSFGFFLDNEAASFQLLHPEWEVEIFSLKNYWQKMPKHKDFAWENKKKEIGESLTLTASIDEEPSFFGFEKYPAVFNRPYLGTNSKSFFLDYETYKKEKEQRWRYFDWVLEWVQKPEIKQKMHIMQPNLLEQPVVLQALYSLSDHFFHPELQKDSRVDILPKTFFDLRDLSYLTDFIVTTEYKKQDSYPSDLIVVFNIFYSSYRERNQQRYVSAMEEIRGYSIDCFESTFYTEWESIAGKNLEVCTQRDFSLSKTTERISNKLPIVPEHSYSALKRPMASNLHLRINPNEIIPFAVSAKFKQLFPHVEMTYAEARDILELSSFPELQIQDTLAYFLKYPHLLSLPEQKEAFKFLLFEAGLLAAEFQQNPADSQQFAHFLASFCKTNYEFYKELEDYETLIFFLEISTYLEAYVTAIQKNFPKSFPLDFVPSFIQLPTEIEDLLKQITLSDEVKVNLKVLLTKSYIFKESLNEHELGELLKTYIMINQIAREDLINSKSVMEIKELYAKKINEIYRMSTGETKDLILNKAVQGLSSHTPSFHWKLDKFPYFTTENGDMTIDVARGIVFEKSGAIKPLPNLVTFDGYFKQIFGTDNHFLSRQTALNTFEFYQDNDHFTIFLKEGSYPVFQRTINDKKYELSDSHFKLAVKHNALKHNHFWYQTSPTEAFISDPKSHQLKYRIEFTADGSWVIHKLDENGKDTGLILHDNFQSTQFSFLERIEDAAEILIWQDQLTGEPKQIELPRYKLDFQIKKGKDQLVAVCSKFGDFTIAEKQHLPCLEDITNYLVLEKKSAKGKLQKMVIFPRLPLKSQESSLFTQTVINDAEVNSFRFLTYDVSNLDTLEAKTVENKLFLALLFLEKKQYEKALKYLQGYRAELKAYTADELEIIKWIVDPNKKNIDPDPKALAVRLQAYAQLLRNGQQFVQQDNTVVNINLKDTYASYLQVKEYAELIKLQPEDEALIIESIYKKNKPYQIPQIIIERTLDLLAKTKSDIWIPVEAKMFLFRQDFLPQQLQYIGHFLNAFFPLPKLPIDFFKPTLHNIQENILKKLRSYLFAEKNAKPLRKSFLDDDFFRTLVTIQQSSTIELEKLKNFVDSLLLSPTSQTATREELLNILRSYLDLVQKSALSSELDRIVTAILLTLFDNPDQFINYEEITKGGVNRYLLEPIIADLVNTAAESKPSFVLSAFAWNYKTPELMVFSNQKQSSELYADPLFEACVSLIESPNQTDHLSKEIGQLIKTLPVVEHASFEETEQTISELKTVLQKTVKDEQIKEQLNELQQRLAAFSHTLKATKINYEITDFAQLSNFKTHLNEIVDLSQKALYLAKSAIEIVANKPFADANQQKIQESRILAELDKPLQLDELIYYFLKRDMKKFHERNPALSAEDISHLNELLKEYLIKAVQIRHAQNLAAKIETIEEAKNQNQNGNINGYIQDFVNEAAKKREYSVEDHPEYLVFEYYMGILLRKDQVESLDAIDIRSGKVGTALELKPGSGKTYVILPILSLLNADGKHLACEILPESLMTSMSQDLQKFLGVAFNQVVETMEFTRNSFLDEATLKRINERLLTIKEKEKVLLMTSSSFQSLYLKFVETLHDYFAALDSRSAASVEKEKELAVYRKIFKEFKDSGRLVIDEAHLILDVLRSFHFTVGEEKALNPLYSQMITDLYLFLAQDQEMKKLLKFNFQSEFSPPPFTPDYYHGSIKPKLVQAVIEGRLGGLATFMQNLSPLEKQYVESFLQDQENREAFSFVAQIADNNIQDILSILKEELSVLLPLTLGKNLGEHYGKAQEQQNLTAIPYHQGEPSDKSSHPNEENNGSQFGTDMEIINYTLQMYLEKDVPKRIVKMELGRLKAAFKREHQRFPYLKLHELESFQEFLELVPQGKNYNLAHISEKDIKEITAHINQNPHLQLELSKRHALSQIKVYETQLNAEPQIFGLLYKTIQVMSGTLWNVDTYPKVISEIFLSDTTPQTLSLIWKKSPEAVGTVQLSQHKKMDLSALQSMLKNVYLENNAKKGSLIDSAGIFRFFANEEVAKQILLLPCWEGTPKKAVSFYNNEGELLLVSRDNDQYALEKMSDSKFSKEEIIAYWDQAHTTGSDIKLDAFMTAAVTIGKHSLLYIGEQAVWRLRELSEEQSIYFVTTDEDQEIIKKELMELTGEEIKGELKRHHLLLYIVLHQAQRKGNDNYRSFSKKMQAIVLKKIIEIILHPTIPNDAVAYIFQDTKKLFASHIDLRPYELFGQMKNKDSKRKIIEQDVKAFIESDILEAFSTNIILRHRFNKDEIIAEIKELAEKEIKKLPEILIQETNYGREKQIQKQKKVEKNINVDVENQKSKQTEISLLDYLLAYPRPVITWPEGNIFSKSYFSPLKIGNIKGQWYTSGQPVMRLQEVLNQYPTTENFSRSLNKDVLCSLNLCSVEYARFAREYSPFGLFQKNMYHILIMQDKVTDAIKIMLLDKNDARYFKQKLREEYKNPSTENRDYKVALYHLETGQLTSGSERIDPAVLENNSDFQKLKIQAKFFNGDVSYSEKEAAHLENWLEENNPEAMKRLFNENILLWKDNPRSIFLNSALDKIFKKLAA